jgi:hypothetical protein
MINLYRSNIWDNCKPQNIVTDIYKQHKFRTCLNCGRMIISIDHEYSQSPFKYLTPNKNWWRSDDDNN